MERWNPPVRLSPQEKLLLKRLKRVRALFGFLRMHRHELFDDEFQERLEAMYRVTGAGAPPHPPALLCMVVLLQGYLGVSDAEAVEFLTISEESSRVRFHAETIVEAHGSGGRAFQRSSSSLWKQRAQQ